MRREPHDILEVVSDQHHRHAHAPAQLVELVVQLLADRAIHGGERLVQQQHLRIARQRARERDR